MRGGSARGYLTSVLAICFAAVLIGGEALILQAPFVDQSDSQPRAEQAADKKQPCRPVPKLNLSWVPIRTQACVALHKNLRFFDAYHDDINALSTLLVAVFTFTLWRTTKGLFIAGERQSTLIQRNVVEQAKQTEESLRIAKQSADAARDAVGLERAWLGAPKISVIQNGAVITFSFIFKNVGKEPVFGLSILACNVFEKDVTTRMKPFQEDKAKIGITHVVDQLAAHKAHVIAPQDEFIIGSEGGLKDTRVDISRVDVESQFHILGNVVYGPANNGIFRQTPFIALVNVNDSRATIARVWAYDAS